MNRDPWEYFAAVFAEELAAQSRWTPEQMDAAADAHDKEPQESKDDADLRSR